MPCYLGIEIGGTKLQLGVGKANSRQLLELVRCEVARESTAEHIRAQIVHTALPLIQKWQPCQVGIGFGGPVDVEGGRTTVSHQVEGWDAFPLVEWSLEQLGLPTLLENDCNAAALAEARLGAGQGHRRVFYVTVGTGIGGGLVVDGRLAGPGRPAMAEIGHLRPAVQCISPEETVESVSSGRAIENRTRAALAKSADSAGGKQLLDLCQGEPGNLTAVMIAEQATEGNPLATRAIHDAVETLGWAIAQVITMTAVEVVVIGGGVSLMDESLFLHPLKEQVARCVFGPLAGSYQLRPAALGEEVVVHGAIACATEA